MVLKEINLYKEECWTLVKIKLINKLIIECESLVFIIATNS